MSGPLPCRVPTSCLEYAREDHQRCLDLAAWYRLRHRCGKPGNLERHAWALGHARTLRGRFDCLLSSSTVALARASPL